MARLKRAMTIRKAKRKKSDDDTRNHFPPLSDLALLREGARRVRDQAAGVARGRAARDHAQARSDPADRRLSQDSGDADRRRHLLRHADHPARAGTALSDAIDLPGQERSRLRHRLLERPPVLPADASASCSARSGTWCRKRSSRTARKCPAAPSPPKRWRRPRRSRKTSGARMPISWPRPWKTAATIWVARSRARRTSTPI